MARRLSYAAVAVLLLSRCGGSSPTAPSLLTEQIVSDHYIFHFSAGDRVDAVWQEAYYLWVVEQLGVSPPVVTYNKYRDRAQMGAATGNSTTNGYAEPATATIHTIWSTDNHEVVHIYASPWGSPVALFGEGFAVAHQTNPQAGDLTPRWSGTPLHDLARQFRSQVRLPSIVSIAETSAFRALDPNVTYPEAGSFVRFLIDTQGMSAMRRLFGAMNPNASLDAVRSAFLATYGFSLDEAGARWQRFLEGT
ncbi:MAG TPA: hypothetical protein VL225_14130 [Vicinamibacterales bacterium]|jgi:hypothetical protein|nr:hypothetical protein [Vicinamibacterales bacterium]